MPRPIETIIHPAALRNNLMRCRRAAENARIWAVIKANAYGHGFTHVVKALSGTDGFALLDLEDAQLVRDLGWRGPILLLEGVFAMRDLELCSRLDLWHTVHHDAQLDMLASFADTALRRNWCRPEFSSEPGIRIEAGRHPVVEGEMEGSGDTFIANDLDLSDSRRLLLITGPNMGGKSTYMRQTALIALLAHVGSFVPAQRAVLGPLDRIFTRIGASDDLASGRSTFMVEMTEAAAILHHASPNSLVLMDEIGRGTSTFDGLALAFAICRHLLEKNRSLTLFATHYFELTRLAQDYPTLANVHLDAVEHGERIVFLHAVEEGPANQSYGIQVAALAGIPGAVVRAAKKELRQLETRAAVDPLQPDLFAAAVASAEAPEEAQHPALERLGEIDPDSLSPREALDLLYELKSLGKA